MCHSSCKYTIAVPPDDIRVWKSTKIDLYIFCVIFNYYVYLQISNSCSSACPIQHRSVPLKHKWSRETFGTSTKYEPREENRVASHGCPVAFSRRMLKALRLPWQPTTTAARCNYLKNARRSPILRLPPPEVASTGRCKSSRQSFASQPIEDIILSFRRWCTFYSYFRHCHQIVFGSRKKRYRCSDVGYCERVLNSFDLSFAVKACA